jgi:hypothetical protein
MVRRGFGIMISRRAHGESLGCSVQNGLASSRLSGVSFCFEPPLLFERQYFVGSVLSVLR